MLDPYEKKRASMTGEQMLHLVKHFIHPALGGNIS